MLAFVSLNLYDFQGFLANDKQSIFFWKTEPNQDFLKLCQENVTGPNPEKDFINLKIEILSNGLKTRYPNNDQIESYIVTYNYNDNEKIDFTNIVLSINMSIESILNKDFLNELTNNEKKFLWANRWKLMNYPSALIKLIQCVNWLDFYHVFEIHNLISIWPQLNVTDSILLLHSDFLDNEIRNFAVKCLEETIKDEELEFYLLQLVQALKNETYLNNSLVKFLLKRAIKSSRIGTKLFWILKSEISNIKYKHRFGLILEAFCRKKGPNFNNLLKQIDVIENLIVLSQQIKNTPNNLNLIKTSFFYNKLEADHKTILSNFVCPIDQSIILGDIESDKSHIISSAKRPLLLTWKNNQAFSNYYQDNFQLIFKNGDDLRQDMLTIQALKLMDNIWKAEGLDLKMIIYEGFPTGDKIGFIEIVKNAFTIFKIQTEGGSKGRYQIDSDQLFKWISTFNQNERLEEAIDNFTKSCAGFCVATFILGIGDRHPSNIMLNTEGKLFHIDFGHFLGHFKTKFGIKRERVPFVLTEDFTKVIAKGSLNPMQTDEFLNGMPELQSIKDVMYLRDKLAVDQTDERALEFFRNQFNESLTFSFTTKVDWVFHALNHRG